MFQFGVCSLGSGSLCGVGGQEMGTKRGQEGRRKGAARSLHMIDPTKSGQVTLVPGEHSSARGSRFGGGASLPEV